MKIILYDGILQLKKFEKSANKTEKINNFKKYLYLKFQKFIKHIGLDDSIINEIKIIPFDKNLGHFAETKPIIINNDLKFDIIFQDIIILWSDDVSEKNFKYAIAIVVHELYHCKEIQITSQHLDYEKICYNPINTTRKYLLNFALHQFSEYYAHFYSSKLHSKSINFDKYVFDSEITLTVLRNLSKDNGNTQLQSYQKNSIELFIKNCVIQIAMYHSTKNEEYIHLLDKYKNTDEYSKHYEYYIRLDNILSDVFKSYPKNLSEDFMINLGKDLMYIMDLFELTYSTEDLSDNFIFIHKN